MFSLTARHESSNSVVEQTDSPLVLLLHVTHEQSPFMAGNSALSSPATKRPHIGSLSSSPIHPSEVRKTRQELSTLRIELERLQTQLLNERTRTEKSLAGKDNRILELEKDRRFLHESEAELRKNCEEARIKLQNELTAVKGQLVEEQKQRNELNAMLLDVEREKKRLMRDLQCMTTERESCKAQFQHEKETLIESIAIKDQQLQSKEQAVSDLQLHLNQVHSKRSSITRNEQRTTLDSEALERLHKLEVSTRRLQHENEVFRESTHNFRLLEEKLHTAECRIEQYRKHEDQYNAAHKERPAEMTTGRELKELIERTAELVKLQERTGELEGQIKTLTMELERLQTTNEQTRKELERYKMELNTTRTSLLTCQQQEAVFRSEIAILKEHIVSLEYCHLIIVGGCRKDGRGGWVELAVVRGGVWSRFNTS
jgi:chromosome segregation ATPase